MIRIQIILAVVLLAFVGCSSGQSPVTPSSGSEQVSQNSGNQSNRTIWGYWTIRIDPDSETVEILPDREAGSHFNVVRLLEVSPCTTCLKIDNLSWLPNNIVQCDFQLTHPFPGLLKLTGFDVRGVLVTDGDTLFPANNRLVSLDGSSPYLINPDGFTPLFNPVEFPPGSAPFPILEYIPGKFSSGDDLTGTLNPFMAFCKDNPRRMFEAGATETVTINLKYPSTPPFEFGYVVDASWVKVDNVIDPVTDFPPEANCLEPYRLDFQMVGKLLEVTDDTAEVRVEVFDHQGIETVSTVSIECPSLFDGEAILSYSSQSGDDSWLYEGVITNEKGAPADSYQVLVRAESLESDANLGELSAYQMAVLEVGNDGSLIWAIRAGGIQWDIGNGVTTLSDNSIVVTGWFNESATFGEGEANETELMISDGWSSDIFVARYNPYGSLLWAKSAGGKYDDEGFGITTLSDDSTVVTGYFKDTATFGEGEANETVLVSAGYGDIFVARYNPDGTLIWAKRAGGTNFYGDSTYGITTLSDDSTVVTGNFLSSATFGEGEANETVLVSDGWKSDIFVARYNPDGTLAWAKRAGGTHGDYGMGITTLSNDSTVVTGYFYESATFGEGEPNETVLATVGLNDIFVARYNINGTLAWAKCPGGPTNAYGFGITSLSDDSTVVTGSFGYSAVFGKGEPNETVMVSDGGYDIFVARYNPDGTLAWAKRAGGTDRDESSGVTTLSDDSSVVTGWFRKSATFGEGEPNETVLESDGATDIFVARFAP